MPDDKKQPNPTQTAKTVGSLYALTLDVREGKAYVGGSAGDVRSLDVRPLPQVKAAADAKKADEKKSDAPAWELGPAVVAAKPNEADYVGALAVASVDGRTQLVVGRYDGSLAWYVRDEKRGTLDTKPLRRTAEAHRGWIRDLVAFDDGRKLASVGDDMLVKIWSAADGRLLGTLKGHATETPQGYVSALYTVAASPDGKQLASGDRAGNVFLWNVADLETDSDRADSEKKPSDRQIGRLAATAFYTFDAEKRDRSFGGVRRVRFSPDGKMLAVAGIGQISNVDGFVGPCRVELWDWRTKKRIITLEDDHKAVLNDVVWSGDGRRIAAIGGGDAGGLLAVWQVDDAKPKQKAKFGGHMHRLAWVEQDRLLLAAGFEGVQLWDMTKLA